MHCDICHVTSESIYLQKKKALNWKIKGQDGPSTTPEGDLAIRRWAGNVPGRIRIDVALRSCRASCDVSAQGNGRWDSVRAGLMYDLYEFNTACASPQYLCHKRCCGSML